MPARYEIAFKDIGEPFECCAMSSTARTEYLLFVEICILPEAFLLSLLILYT